MDGIEAVRMQRIIEIDKVELRLHVIAVVIVQQLVENLVRQARKLVVVYEHRILLLNHLPHESRIDSHRFTGAGRSQYHAAALRRDAVDIRIPEFAFILVLDGNIDAELILDAFLTLFKGVPIVRKFPIVTAELPAEKNGTDEHQQIAGKSGKKIERPISKEGAAIEKSQADTQRCKYFSPT